MYGGSEWRKWDLHLHCPEDVLNNQFKGIGQEEKMNNYLRKLEQSELEIIGLTNYFCINGYDKIVEHRSRGRIPNIKLLLPNIEFRITQPNKEGDHINLHLLFSNEVEAGRIKEFLNRLHLLNTDEENKARYCSPAHLASIGYDKALIGIRCLQETLEENFIHLKDYLVFGIPRGHGSFRPEKNEGRGITVAIEIDKISDAFFGNVNDIQHFLNTGRYDGAIPKPVVSGSDAHRLDMIGSGFTWIKANPTFEGLKQIIYEPEERVRIQLENPEPRKNIYTLGSIEIRNSQINDELSIEERLIPLNRNLIGITGGKGSGKTALLDLLANCFEDRCKRGNSDNEDKNSFVQRIEDEKSDLKVKIGFIGENTEKFSKELISEKLFQDSKITYLPQGKIEEYSGNRQKLNKKVEEIIFGNEEIMSTGYKQHFDELKDEIAMLTSRIGEINVEIHKLEEETRKNIIDDIEAQKLIQKGQLTDRRDELRELTENIEEDIAKRIEEIKTEENRLQAKLSKLKEIEVGLGKFRSELEKKMDDFNIKANEFNRELQEIAFLFSIELKHQTDLYNNRISESLQQELRNNGISFSQDASVSIEQKNGKFIMKDNEKAFIIRKEGDKLSIYDLIMYLVIPQLDFEPQLGAIKKALNLIPQSNRQVKKQIEDGKKQLEQLSGVDKAHTDLLKEIEGIKTRIEELQANLAKLDEKKERIGSLETERIENYHSLVAKYRGLKDYYDKVIVKFSEGKSEIMSGIDFKTAIEFDTARFVKRGCDILDMRRINENDIEKYAEELESIVIESDYSQFTNRLQKLIKEILKRKEILKGERSNDDFYEWLFGNYCSLNTEILFNGILMNKLSMGQKGTVLLKLFLAEGDYPLIIDQPEENLDNEFISYELVDAFRDAKKKRQIMIATNNANLIVNTDAEQIIVANFENNRISYKLGSLEDLGIREDIIQVLEGGEKAFRKRERKYGI